MKRGQTIVAERERQELASERMLARKKMKNKRILSVVAVVLILIILTILGVMLWQVLFKDQVMKTSEPEVVVPEPTVEIVDEAGVGVSGRIKEYIAWLEQDFKELGYTMTRVDLPRDKSRELLVSLEGYDGYIKMNIDRGTGVSVEDADRMIKYLNGGGFEYIDVRVEGKAFYK